MKAKKCIAGIIACMALLAAVPMLPAEMGMNIGITAEAAENTTFVGVVKKTIAVGYLVTPAEGSEAEAIAGQFMVKYTDTESFNVGDTITIEYSGDPEVDSGIATVTATSIVAGSASTTPVEPVNVETPTTDVTATEATPETGEGSMLFGLASIALIAGAVSKKIK